MLPYKTLIKLDKNAKTPIYQQFSSQLMGLIRGGILLPNQRIPSSRVFSELLSIHRKTVLVAIEDLLAQGWLSTKAGSGTFVAANLPIVKTDKLKDIATLQPKTAGFAFEPHSILNRPIVRASDLLHLDDGFPDPRLAPLAELSRAYRSSLLTGNAYVKLGYTDTQGASRLRTALSSFLNESRGLHIIPSNILIVRGTMMAMYLTTRAFIKPCDNVVLGQQSWNSAAVNFKQAGANILTIPTDQNGLDIDALEELCKTQTIRLLYVTSHHDYPTTVTLKADRRLKLLKLAEQYRFIVFEDDYDYDFHYLSKPLLPLASADTAGVVLYTGSFTKSISPALRVGYIIGPEDAISHLAQYRRIVDRQGDSILENALAELMNDGTLQRHLRKSLRVYKERRDFFCNLLKTELKDEISFETPEGGMAVWTKFCPEIDLIKTAEKALKNGLYFSDGSQHEGLKNATRLGFASSTVEELEQCVKILKGSIVVR